MFLLRLWRCFHTNTFAMRIQSARNRQNQCTNADTVRDSTPILPILWSAFDIPFIAFIILLIDWKIVYRCWCFIRFAIKTSTWNYDVTNQVNDNKQHVSILLTRMIRHLFFCCWYFCCCSLAVGMCEWARVFFYFFIRRNFQSNGNE